jgi:hypothetical protein
MIVPMAHPNLRQAVELLAAGDWQAAHEIVQEDQSLFAAWLHGIVHTIEGDFDNARYWYGQAGRAFRGPEAVQEEITAARESAVSSEDETDRPRN